MGRTLGHLLISSASRNIDIKSEAKESTRHTSQSSIESVTFFKSNNAFRLAGTDGKVLLSLWQIKGSYPLFSLPFLCITSTDHVFSRSIIATESFI